MSISMQSNQPNPTSIEQGVFASSLSDDQPSQSGASKKSQAAIAVAIVSAVLSIICLGYAASLSGKITEIENARIEDGLFWGELGSEMGVFKEETEKRLDALELNLLDSTATDTDTGYPLKYKAYIDAYTDENGILDMDGLLEDYPEVFADIASSG